MLLNNVLAGFEYTTLLNKPELKGPPQGYDSVCILLFRCDDTRRSDLPSKTGVRETWQGSELRRAGGLY